MRRSTRVAPPPSTLANFRVAHAAVLERLLADGVAALAAEGLVALDVLAQDGWWVRAAAGASHATAELALGLVLAAMRQIPRQIRSLKSCRAGPAVGFSPTAISCLCTCFDRILAYAAGSPVRVANPEVLAAAQPGMRS